MNGNTVLVDTGPLVAWVNRADAGHDWAREQWQRLRPPLLTCEPVLTEAAFLLANHAQDPVTVLDLIEQGVIQVAFNVEDNAAELGQLMRRYRNVPMSLADACLVRMAEIHRNAVVFTLDADFRIYRKHARHVIPTLSPPVD